MKYILFAIITLFCTHGHALLLENLIKNDTLAATFSNKKIGYYTGAFDPPHNGHAEFAQLTVKEKICDYVFIYPDWTSIDTKMSPGYAPKNKSPINLRLEMLVAAFEDHPNIIVTRLTPQQVQKALTDSDTRTKIANKNTVKPKFKGMTFIGLAGTDTAGWINSYNAKTCNNMNNPVPTECAKFTNEKLYGYMRGIAIPDDFDKDTVGTSWALPVDSFVIAVRNGQAKDLEKFKNNSVSDRAIIKVLSGFKHDEVSSTFVRTARKEGRMDSLPIHPKVLKIIKDNNLFADTAAKQAQGAEQSQSMLSNVWKKIKGIVGR